jgi:hypothetical protein
LTDILCAEMMMTTGDEHWCHPWYQSCQHRHSHTEKLALGILPIWKHHTVVGCKRSSHRQREGATAGQLISSWWWPFGTWRWQGLTWHHRALLQCNRGHSWMQLGYRTCHCTISAVGPNIVLSRD